MRKLRTFIYPGIDSFVRYPFSVRLVLPFSKSNNVLFHSIKTKVRNKFNVNIKPGFSSYPNLKQILCKPKFS